MQSNFQFLPPSASTYSDEVDYLYLFMIGLTAFFTLLIFVMVVVFAIKYRRRPGNGAVQMHGSTTLELVWTIIPLIISMGIFAWGTRLFFTVSMPPANCMTYYVTGKQWMWKVQHPTGQREINTMHVPTGVPIQVKMISEDVIHSYFIPAFRVKRDVLPGRYSVLWFEATKPGTYHLFCAEYCGTKHSEMIGKVVVMEPGDYERWLSGATSGESPRDQGEKLFAAMRCDTCHTGLEGARGPDLAGIYGTEVKLADGSTVAFDDAYARESILNPAARLVQGYTALMPTFAGQLSEEQVLSLIEYIKSMKSNSRGAAKP